MSQRQPQRLLLDDLLRLLIEAAAFGLVVAGFAIGDQLVQRLVAITREVEAGLDRRAGELRGKEIVRVAVVAGPAHEQQVVLAGLGAADQLAPLDHANLGVDAHLGQVGLQQLRAEARVGVEQAAAGARPDGGLETLRQASLGQQGAGLVRIIRITGQIAGIAPGVRRVRAAGRFGAALEHRLDVAGLVERQVDRLAHLRLVQRRMLTVDADEGRHEGGGLCAFQLGVASDGLHVLRFWRQGDLAFATA